MAALRALYDSAANTGTKYLVNLAHPRLPTENHAPNLTITDNSEETKTGLTNALNNFRESAFGTFLFNMFYYAAVVAVIIGLMHTFWTLIKGRGGGMGGGGMSGALKVLWKYLLGAVILVLIPVLIIPLVVMLMWILIQLVSWINSAFQSDPTSTSE